MQEVNKLMLREDLAQDWAQQLVLSNGNGFSELLLYNKPPQNFFFFFFVFFPFLGPLPQPMEVPRLGVESEL